MTRLRRHSLAVLSAVLLIAGCTHLPAGIDAVPPGTPDSAVLTLPGGRAVAVYPERLQFTGSARLLWPDGRSYEGAWSNGRPHGEGTETLPDGTRYRGQWRAGQRHGRGELVAADGSRYVGEFVADRREGQGTLTGPDGSYRGGWAGDVPHGRGVFEAADGARYRGDWVLGRRSGHGRFEAADGASYEGDWSHDQAHGFGRAQDADGTSYDGGWQDGRRHGYGRSEGPPELVYEGTWRADRQHGYGRERRPDGSSYLGQWRDGKRHGHGLELLPDGSYHDGTWELNRILGPGHRRSATGIEIRGVWNGDVVSAGLLSLPTGAEYGGPLFAGSRRRAAPRLLDWLKTSAIAGDPYAQLMLGTLYLEMEEPPPDLARARHWLSRAAAAGIAEAQFRLALTFEELDPPRVVELLAQAGAQGHSRANETLGEYYYGGITVPHNLAHASRYFQRAVDAGSVTARNNLAWLLATAHDASLRDGARAIELIQGIALYSGHWQYLDTLAAAWAASGDFAQAARVARRALEAASRESTDGMPLELENLQRRLARYQAGRAHVAAPP